MRSKRYGISYWVLNNNKINVHDTYASMEKPDASQHHSLSNEISGVDG